jgi:hypothetical protein
LNPIPETGNKDRVQGSGIPDFTLYRIENPDFVSGTISEVQDMGDCVRLTLANHAGLYNALPPRHSLTLMGQPAHPKLNWTEKGVITMAAKVALEVERSFASLSMEPDADLTVRLGTNIDKHPVLLCYLNHRFVREIRIMSLTITSNDSAMSSGSRWDQIQLVRVKYTPESTTRNCVIWEARTYEILDKQNGQQIS